MIIINVYVNAKFHRFAGQFPAHGKPALIPHHLPKPEHIPLPHKPIVPHLMPKPEFVHKQGIHPVLPHKDPHLVNPYAFRKPLLFGGKFGYRPYKPLFGGGHPPYGPHGVHG